ncbi:carboxymuconolactone decarboxylase family protein [Luteibacter yeojuensis]|uniref:Carboxymuconolactone decarboxylase family protein n=1 Tax=Luteibacter yeojuensis TaxID=345309 RepID=A0A7X5TQE4_9GAMM|nr:carboxymuconolactone decarboxylase family protein [Luteibacter yeojuensis]NID15995.1 carboxymuconolactone decarboxylase family protein [Luteibacter yeojuensis]
MSRTTIPAVDTATGATAEVYATVRKMAGGKVPNMFAALGHLSPELTTAYLDADTALASAGLSRKDLETIKLLVSAQTGCDYCVAAHNMLGKMAGLSADDVRAIRHMEGTGDAKRDALIRFVLGILRQNGTVPAAAVEDIRAAGYSDAQLLAISYAMAMITFTNTFNRINDTDVDFPAAE